MIESALRWTWVLASLAGAVWLWLNMDLPVLSKVIVVGVLWAFWLGVVAIAVALLALLLGMLGFVARPFKR